MIVTHAFRAAGKCPVNGQPDNYEVSMTLEVSSAAASPWVEEISAEVAKLTAAAMSQEAFTEALAAAFGAKVVTRCRHGIFDTVYSS